MAIYSEVIPGAAGFYVYRFWAKDGTCLYVGRTGEVGPRRLGERLAGHRCHTPWWPEVARIDAAALGSPEEIIAEERSQIVRLKPVHNKHLIVTEEENAQARAAYLREYVQRPEVKRKRAAYRREYVQRPEVKIKRLAYLRRAQRRPSPGQQSLWGGGHAPAG